MSLAYDAFCNRRVDPGHHVGRAKPPISGQGRGPECREREWEAAAAERFSCILKASDSLSWNFLWPSSGPLNPSIPLTLRAEAVDACEV